MNSFVFGIPTSLVFGKDALDSLAAEITRHNCKKVLVVYGGGSTVKSGVLGKVTDKLKEANISFIEKGGVQPNPILSFVYETRELAMKEGVDFILAVGGGSTIDTAKAVSLAVAEPDIDVWEYYKKTKVPQKGLKVGAVLTIAAAGSETSDSTVITNTETKEKLAFNSDYVRPVFAILNPEFTFTLPKYQVACGVVDVFMHTSDRYFSADYGNELTDQIAEGLMRTVFMYGKKAVDCPTDYEAMSEIMWSGTMSHSKITGLGNARDFSVHNLGVDMSGLYNCTHGATLSVCWVGFANYVYKHDLPRFARYARNVWGLEGDDATIAKEAIDKTRDFFVSLNMPITITELMGDKMYDGMTEELALACSLNKTRSFGAIYTFKYEDMKAIFESVK